MNIVAVFQLSAPSRDRIDEFKKKLSEKGYYSAWISGKKRVQLPETCVWKMDSTVEVVKDEIVQIEKELSKSSDFKVEFLLAVPASPWAVNLPSISDLHN